MESPNRSVSREDYLEAILMIQNKKGSCHSVDVARFLGYSKPSVTIAMKKLIAYGDVKKDELGHLQLTPQGLETAEKMLRRHTTLTTLFTALGVSDDVADKDACAIEHLISDETFDAIRKHMDMLS